MHPDDTTAYRALLAELRAVREAAGMSLGRLGDRCGVPKQHVGAIERGEPQSMQLATLHRIAGGLNRQVCYTLDGLPDPPAETRYTASLLAMFEQTGDPILLSARLMARIGAARRWLDLTLAEVGAALGITGGTVHRLEQPIDDVKLSTPQRLCRAMGGSLRIELVTAGDEAQHLDGLPEPGRRAVVGSG
jgi:transcriptional regulator with XRE-family HTH domain